MKTSSLVSQVFLAMGISLVIISMGIYSATAKADCSYCDEGEPLCSGESYTTGCGAGVCDGGIRCDFGDCTCQVGGLFFNKCWCN